MTREYPDPVLMEVLAGARSDARQDDLRRQSRQSPTVAIAHPGGVGEDAFTVPGDVIP